MEGPMFGCSLREHLNREVFFPGACYRVDLGEFSGDTVNREITVLTILGILRLRDRCGLRRTNERVPRRTTRGC